MWVSTINGKEEKRQDIEHCFMWFPWFYYDLPALFDAGIIKRIDFDQYEWTKSKTSLAEYFKWIGNNARDIPGGFWKPIETVFKVNRRTLSKLAGHNANDLKPEESRHFKEIRKLVEQYRAQTGQDQKDRETFNSIKNLIEETESKDIKKIRAALKKIKSFLD